jgi:putative intracellular protease/amidase
MNAPAPTPPTELLVICARRYNGHELWTALGIFQNRGHTFEVVSTDTTIKDELTFQPNTLSRRVYDITPAEIDLFKGVVVVSGNMKDTEAYWTDAHVQNLIKEARALDKVVAAICCSVPTLAGVVKDVPVSFFPLQRSRRRLAAGGAILTNVALTVSPEHKIATAEHQMATQMWATEICNLVEGLPPSYTFTDSGYRPKGRLRRMPPGVGESIEEARQTRRANNGN